MLHHQTTSSLSPSFFSPLQLYPPPPSYSVPVRLPYSRSSQPEKEKVMESVEFSFARQHQGFDADDDVAWAVEKGGLLGTEDFLVDDLLDLGELETEEEDQPHKEAESEGKGGAEEMAIGEDKSSSSAVSFEDPHPVSEVSLPDHDVASLEWVSRMVDDSLCEFPTYANQVQAQPPTPPPSAVPVRAKRSKRTRTLSGSSWSSSSSWGEGSGLVFLDSLVSSSTTTTSSTSSCSSSSYSSSQFIFAYSLLDEIPLSQPPPSSKSLNLKKQQKPKKRGPKPKTEEANGGGGERQCTHCGVNKTPQWRTGPMGAKTLCNACGVRYKSGRLLPEYRPACSPTFISHVHSNSHRKVVEMRRKKEEEQVKKKLLLVSSALPIASF